MKTENLHKLNDIELRVFRIRPVQQGGKEICKKVAIHVTLWTNDPGNRLEFIKIKNSKRKEALKLNLAVKNDGVPCKSNSLLPIVFSKVFDAESLDFQFESDGQDLLIVDVNLEPTNRPKGTKRKVITYEDTDIIDDGM